MRWPLPCNESYDSDGLHLSMCFINNEHVLVISSNEILRCGHVLTKGSEIAAKFKENRVNPLILVLLYLLWISLRSISEHFASGWPHI